MVTSIEQGDETDGSLRGCSVDVHRKVGEQVELPLLKRRRTPPGKSQLERPRSTRGVVWRGGGPFYKRHPKPSPRNLVLLNRTPRFGRAVAKDGIFPPELLKVHPRLTYRRSPPRNRVEWRRTVSGIESSEFSLPWRRLTERVEPHKQRMRL